MSTEPEVTPPPADTPETLPTEPPHVSFSGVHWFSKGVVRLSYRGWTRVAAFLFPGGFKSRTYRASVAYSLA